MSCALLLFASSMLEAKGVSKATHLENLTIDYHFMDDESFEKENGINELIKNASRLSGIAGKTFGAE